MVFEIVARDSIKIMYKTRVGLAEGRYGMDKEGTNGKIPFDEALLKDGEKMAFEYKDQIVGIVTMGR